MAEPDPPPSLPKKTTTTGSSTTQMSRNNTHNTKNNKQSKKERFSISLWIKFTQQADQPIDVDILHVGLLECFYDVDDSIVVQANRGNKKLPLANLLNTPEEHPQLFSHRNYTNNNSNFATISHKIEAAISLPSLLRHERVKAYLAGNNVIVKTRKSPKEQYTQLGWIQNVNSEFVLHKYVACGLYNTLFPRLTPDKIEELENANVGSKNDQLFDFRIFEKTINVTYKNKHMATRALVFQVPTIVSQLVDSAMSHVIAENDGAFPNSHDVMLYSTARTMEEDD
jgi:hypothetical protein